MTERELMGYILLASVLTAVAAWVGWRLARSPRRLHRKRMREKQSWSKSMSRLQDD